MGFFSRRRSGKGPQLAWRGDSTGFSQVAAGFLSMYDGDLRDCFWGLRKVQSPRESRGAPLDSSAVSAGVVVLIWS